MRRPGRCLGVGCAQHQLRALSRADESSSRVRARIGLLLKMATVSADRIQPPARDAAPSTRACAPPQRLLARSCACGCRLHRSPHRGRRAQMRNIGHPPFEDGQRFRKVIPDRLVPVRPGRAGVIMTVSREISPSSPLDPRTNTIVDSVDISSNGTELPIRTACPSSRE